MVSFHLFSLKRGGAGRKKSPDQEAKVQERGCAPEKVLPQWGRGPGRRREPVSAVAEGEGAGGDGGRHVLCGIRWRGFLSERFLGVGKV